MISEFDHPEHCWKWTPLEVEYLNKKFSEKDALLKQALKTLRHNRAFVQDGASHKSVMAYNELIDALEQHLGEA